jgi:RNA polymerase sigma-70 factor (ECF subfamily)
MPPDAPWTGEKETFRRLVEGQRAALHAHCHQMLGSLHDAEDAVQETMLRAWRGLPGFEGRSSLSSWLHQIATNVCSDAIHRRRKHTQPFEYAAATRPGREAPWELEREPTSIQLHPDRELEIRDGAAAPDAQCERREAVGLAFTAAQQVLSARQRAMLILRDVLGFSAKDAAVMLETTVASINSALQRARRAIDEHPLEESHEAGLRSVGDARVRDLVRRFVNARAERHRRDPRARRGGCDVGNADFTVAGVEAATRASTRGRSSVRDRDPRHPPTPVEASSRLTPGGATPGLTERAGPAPIAANKPTTE